MLFAGDVIMNRRFLGFNAPLSPKRIVPSHGEMGDGSLIETNRTYLQALQARAAELKHQGKSVDETADALTAEFKSKYPDWTGNAGAAARVAHMEAK